MDMSKVFKSSLGIKYPTFRDYPLHFDAKWLDGKRMDDGAEGYWRIHDNIYDLTEFIGMHPGGKDWLKLTKGTDITEAFESHHLTSKAENLLPRYFLKKATTPRNFPFTFHETGFYKTLKRRIVQKLKSLPRNSSDRTKLLTDTIFAAYIGTFILAVYFQSFSIGVVSGICLCLLTVAAHNFLHRKDNFRMFYFDFCMMSSKGWRVSHVLSHHMYPNTVSDIEVSVVEPIFQYLPGDKPFIVRYLSWLYFPVIYTVLFKLLFVRNVLQGFFSKSMEIPWTLILPFTVPALSWCLTGQSIWCCFTMFLFIMTVGSIHFAIVGLNAAHHHPDIFHDGDTPRPQTEMDWAIFQMDTVMDRKDVTGSPFLVLTNFGDHALHHLFPTLDHGYLEHLYPVFLETCDEFGVDWRSVTHLDLIKGQFRQLAKVSPKKSAPKRLLKGAL